MPPSPILRSTRYSPTSIPSGRSTDGGPLLGRLSVGSYVPSFMVSGGRARGFERPPLRSAPPPSPPPQHDRPDQRQAQPTRGPATAARADIAPATAATTLGRSARVVAGGAVGRCSVVAAGPARAAAAARAATCVRHAQIGDGGARARGVGRLAHAHARAALALDVLIVA